MDLPLDITHSILAKLSINEIKSSIALTNKFWYTVSQEAISSRLQRLYLAKWLNFQLDYKEGRKTYIKLDKLPYDRGRYAIPCQVSDDDQQMDGSSLTPVFQLNGGYTSNFDLEMVISFTENSKEPFFIDWAMIDNTQKVSSASNCYHVSVGFALMSDVDMSNKKLYRWRYKRTPFEVNSGPPPDGRCFIISEVSINAMHIAVLLEELLHVDIDACYSCTTLETP
ncbi:hypothetical protein INT43_005404 [Umbelopsis isabellina]|uniref:F-box domain-containing protein n=1 Tax=Mortierella isabellina TaxID=91625 RepID=A0A8H7PLM1_MORIS|nr:hypothetical protein INT43_005404 [Umbelopsis isabellina]